jgi:hypothetical protein
MTRFHNPETSLIVQSHRLQSETQGQHIRDPLPKRWRGFTFSHADAQTCCYIEQTAYLDMIATQTTSDRVHISHFEHPSMLGAVERSFDQRLII